MINNNFGYIRAHHSKTTIYKRSQYMCNDQELEQSETKFGPQIRNAEITKIADS